uniref:Uncharacterized protein n=1 Tax=Candidatus Kentrum sp. SD TaxID=2126332 RepID=A0A450Z339_9GAMM|nr:MAG: hypothetical protein BECKSD772F_GA0070984_11285 [Candidatus Kentron sp. SD]VFK48118.1 MAG: hypothetical protein BECKSD772E_GA0070983_11145 [Candidatus Kentron sp. SD]
MTIPGRVIGVRCDSRSRLPFSYSSHSYPTIGHRNQNIAPVNRPVLEQALLSRISNFEDAVLEQSGLLVGADVIVTRVIPGIL